MPECSRCGDFTDNPGRGDYQYCEDCLDHFATVEDHGVVVHHASRDNIHVTVTASGEEFDGGTEDSQVDGLARGKYIADETGLPAMFTYAKTGSQWDLEAYLRQHPGIRSKVQERLRRVPSKTPEGLLERIRAVL